MDTLDSSLSTKVKSLKVSPFYKSIGEYRVHLWILLMKLFSVLPRNIHVRGQLNVGILVLVKALK